MNVIRSIFMAFAMFSCIPMPRIAWGTENLRYMLCALPLVGLPIGLVLWGWSALALPFGFGQVLFATGLTLLPIAVSGGIHLDGFCDTVDALSSHADPAKKHEILKDPRAGAFAVIGVSCYVLAYFALCTELRMRPDTVLLLAVMHVLSRVIGALCTLLYPARTEQQGLAATFRKSANKHMAAVILMIELIACAVVLFLNNTPTAIAMMTCALLVMLILHHIVQKQFCGMSGDLAGFAIQVSELMMLFAIVLIQRMVLI
ncbi:MAG: adenosylcobinamide-GDP ribazoletransferase [Clostridia bacterium]